MIYNCRKSVTFVSEATGKTSSLTPTLGNRYELEMETVDGEREGGREGGREREGERD